MKMTDGKKTVEITMKVWNDYNTGYSPDWSNDFFNAGILPYDEDEDFFIVYDVDYCIEQAEEWEAEDENNAVFVDEL
jgi:hypothetical protein